MAYNKYRWWTKGRPNKPLKSDAPLLLKIRNGDFDYSYMFSEARAVKESAQKACEIAYKNYGGTDEQNRIQASLEAGRMKRIKAIKLELEAYANENKILWALQTELKKEFGKDLWEKAMDTKRDFKSVENLYYWYKKQVKEATTKSEMDMQFKRSNTKGLEYLFI
jgi:hypothetical protein